MDNPSENGIEILEKELAEMERIGSDCMPSLNHFLEAKGLYVTKEDIRALREILKKKKYKLVRVHDYQIIRRGKKK